MHAGMPSDEVTDAIAHIEMHRQETQKESGLAASCSESLRKLHALLEGERAAQQAAGGGNPANVEAVMTEIRRIRNLAGSANQSANLKRAHRGRQPPPVAHPRGPRNPPRNKGRRRMGRQGDR